MPPPAQPAGIFFVYTFSQWIHKILRSKHMDSRSHPVQCRSQSLGDLTCRRFFYGEAWQIAERGILSGIVKLQVDLNPKKKGGVFEE